MKFDYDKIRQKHPDAKIIGVFGGTFDPPHVGHVSVASFLLSTGYFDRIDVFPVNSHPHCKNPTAPYETRMDMCDIAFSCLDYRRLRVRDTRAFTESYGISERSYDLLEASKSSVRLPVLIVGQDNSEDVIASSWHRGEELIQNFYVYNFPRGVIPCSSTLIRNAIRDKEWSVARRWLHNDVFNIARGVYRFEPNKE